MEQQERKISTYAELYQPNGSVLRMTAWMAAVVRREGEGAPSRAPSSSCPHHGNSQSPVPSISCLISCSESISSALSATLVPGALVWSPICVFCAANVGNNSDAANAGNASDVEDQTALLAVESLVPEPEPECTEKSFVWAY